MQVKKFMTTSVVTVREDTPVEEAARLLVSHGYTVLPVVDDGGGLLGVVSETDLIDGRILPDPRALIADVSPGASSGQLVAELMSKDPVAVDSTVDPAAVARLMLDHHLHAVPVVEEGRLAGIVTCRDVLRTITRDDHDIARDVRHRLAAACRDPWTVDVVEGVATLTTETTASGEHHIAQVIAGALPGVVEVRLVGPHRAGSSV